MIKVLWPEPAEDGTTVTRDARFGEGIYVKVRWFVVAKEGKHFSTCLYDFLHRYNPRYTNILKADPNLQRSWRNHVYYFITTP